MAEETEKEKKKRLKNFFEKAKNIRNVEPIEEDDYLKPDGQRQEKDKKAKRRGLGWLIALGVLAAAATLSLPAVFIFATKFATLPLIGLLIGTGVVGLDIGLLASIRLSRRRRKERKAIKAFSEDIKSEKSKQLVSEHKFLTDRYVEQYSSKLSEDKIKENKEKLEKMDAFCEIDKNRCLLSEQEELEKAQKKDDKDLTLDDKKLLLKCFSVSEDKVRKEFGDSYIQFKKPYICKELSFKNGENIETIDLQDYKIYSYQGFKAFEREYSQMCERLGVKEAKLSFMNKGASRKETNQYAELNDEKTQNATEAMARSM